MNIDGVVLLDKPEGLSSNAALQRAKRALGADKAGHTGTLDPMATGLLPLCLGEATKFSQGLLDADKGYLATARLGATTDTGDREGRILVERPVEIDGGAIGPVLAALTGMIKQIPPMYSAIKHQGRPLYAIARAGGEVARAARTVHIRRLTLIDWSPPCLTFEVHCSKGTYVRTLAEAIGERLGTGAHLIALRRTAVGPFRLDRAVTLDALQAASPEQRRQWVLPADLLVQQLPAIELALADARRLMQGRELSLSDAQCASVGAGLTVAPAGDDPAVGQVLVRVYCREADPGNVDPGDATARSGQAGFLGVAGVTPSGRLRAVRLIAHICTPEVPETVRPGPESAETT